MTRSNRALLAYLNGATTTAPSFDRTNIDKLLDDVEQAFAGSVKPDKTPVAKREESTPVSAKRPRDCLSAQE